MAEGGGEEHNPFSFKKFVNEKDKKPKEKVVNNKLDIDEDDIFGLGKAKPKRTEKLRLEKENHQGIQGKEDNEVKSHATLIPSPRHHGLDHDNSAGADGASECNYSLVPIV